MLNGLGEDLHRMRLLDQHRAAAREAAVRQCLRDPKLGRLRTALGYRLISMGMRLLTTPPLSAPGSR